MAQEQQMVHEEITILKQTVASMHAPSQPHALYQPVLLSPNLARIFVAVG